MEKRKQNLLTAELHQPQVPPYTYEQGLVARQNGLTIQRNPFDSTYRRGDYLEWRRGWFAGTHEQAFNDSKFLCDKCHKPLTHVTHQATNDHGGMTCLLGCDMHYLLSHQRM